MSRINVEQVIQEFNALQQARLAWEKYWRSVAMFVLPHTANFDILFSQSGGSPGAINAVVDTPIASEKSKNVYDMTSLWGVERLSAGLVSLKTPESMFWHDMGVDTDFDYETSHEEKVALEKLRNYMFKVRANPKSGFWSAHKTAVKSMCAFGDGWMYIEEQLGARLPYRYEMLPLTQAYPAVGPNGQPNRMGRVFNWSAVQIMTKWPNITNAKVKNAANDPVRKHDRMKVMQMVRPREDSDRYGQLGARGGAFSSYYCLPEETYEIAEGGFYEFPFVRYAWNNSGASPFSEGPVAIALGEIKSLNEMAKNELLSTQMLLRPPIATYGKNMQRINFNAGAVNPGLINGDGQPLFAAINGGVRPDFAKEVMAARRGNLREMLYLNLWQILLDAGPQDTATAALIRAQEKGELLGPVGISMNGGLSAMADREVGILARKGAFDEKSPLAMPESLQGQDVSPQFTSPLDRLRRVGELVATQRLVEFATGLAEIKPEIINRIDADEALENAQEILGAPVKVLVGREDAKKVTDAMAQSAGAAQAAMAAKMGGEAVKAVGEGAVAGTQGAEAVAASPVAQKAIQQYQAAAA